MFCKCLKKHELYYVEKAKRVKCTACKRFVDQVREINFIEYRKSLGGDG